MATGYTSGVADGKITDFKTFALKCARAFGPLISMRDDSWDAPVPDEIVPSNYDADQLKDAEMKLARLQVMPAAEIRAEARAKHEPRLAAEREMDEKHAETRNRYEAMLAQVLRWSPPTADHFGLKKFMVEQLSESIKCDCARYPSDVTEQSPERWHANAVKSAKRDIEYHRTEHAKEVAGAARATQWLRDLRNSLESVETVK